MLTLLVAPSEPGAPGSGSTRTASLPATSVRLPLPVTARAPGPAYSRASDRSPGCTSYLNASELDSLPSKYAAVTFPPSSASPKVGSGGPSTTTGSLKVTLTSSGEPAPYVPLGTETFSTRGAIPSIVTLAL